MSLPSLRRQGLGVTGEQREGGDESRREENKQNFPSQTYSKINFLFKTTTIIYF